MGIPAALEILAAVEIPEDVEILFDLLVEREASALSLVVCLLSLDTRTDHLGELGCS